jgi:hypothetical protein
MNDKSLFSLFSSFRFSGSCGRPEKPNRPDRPEKLIKFIVYRSLFIVNQSAITRGEVERWKKQASQGKKL